MDLVNDGRWLFKSLGEKLEGKDGGSSVMARAGGCQASPLINPNIIKRKTPGSYTVLMGGLRKFMPPVTYYCKKKKTCKILLPKTPNPKPSNSRLHQLKGTERHVEWHHIDATDKLQNEGNPRGQMVNNFFNKLRERRS